MHTLQSQSTRLLRLAQADGRERGPPPVLTDGSMFLQTGKKNNSKLEEISGGQLVQSRWTKVTPERLVSNKFSKKEVSKNRCYGLSRKHIPVLASPPS